MAYVNFRNEQTFHVYRFLTTRPGGYVHQLLAWAFDQAANDKSIDVDGPTAVLLEHIALRVEEHVHLLALEGGFGSSPEENGETMIGDECDGTPDSLFLPVLWNTLREIDFYAVGEAILRDRGKWAPELVMSDAAAEDNGTAADADDGGSAVEA